MSSKVDQFLSESGGNNFTETAPRPPVPGEENEKESNGGMSTRSSASSHKSHVSHTSGRSNSSNKGDINPATPRKSNIDKNNVSLSCSLQGFDDEMDAPLGFEPEGSAANSPPFTENSTPPCSRWAKSLHMLLDDRDGVQLFRTFLDQEGVGTFSLDFWFACQGLKLKGSVTDNTQVIRVIYKKYIKSDKLPYLESETKKKILEHIQSGIDLSIFNAAQAEVERYMANDAYPAFLKSDLYVQYFARGGESSNSSSGSNSARPVSSGPLPTVREDQELEQDDFVQPFNMGPPSSKQFARTPNSDSRRQEVFSGPSSFPRPVPYHISYAPTSAQDSEIQSLSSQDALTDDTRSLTDSSVDGHSYRESRRQRKMLKAMQKRAGQNKEMGPHIPRTDRAPKDRTLAEVDPKQFAEQLIIKLEKVLKEQEKEQRVHMIMNQSDVSESLIDKSCVSSLSSRNNTATSIVPLLTSSMIDEENADSILEEHCSRIWERSAQQTPSRSPGRHSPRSRSPDRHRKPLSQPQAHSGSSSMPGTLHTKPLNSKKRGEFYSSFDSGMGDDSNNKCSVETHKHIHHHHHHHHERERSGRRSKHKLELQAQQHSMFCWADATPRAHGGARQKTMSRSHSDNCSNLDSGISMIESVSQYPDVSVTDPAKTKVLQWILDNENMNRGTSTAYTDSDKTSSTHKRSHKSSALNPGSQPYSKTCSKKGSGNHINRSASADSCSRVPWVPPGGVMPSQPIVQDPSMPLMPPPNTRVQLEEVTRRLETDHSLKSKSFTGPNKDKRPGVPAGQGRVPTLPSGRMAQSDLDTSGDSSRTEKQMKRSSGSVNTSTSSKPDETVIGYFLPGEPIPYRTTVPHPNVTLGQLKQLISKRGNFRYFVKTHSRDFDSEVVYEEIKEDAKILPVFDGKVIVKIDKIDDIESPNKSNGGKR